MYQNEHQPLVQQQQNKSRNDTDNHADKEESSFSLEKVAELTRLLSQKTQVAINQIDRINGETQVLSINALIEASRAGEVGKTFSVVAEEMSKLSKKIEGTTENLRRESIGTMEEMGKIITKQITSIRGIRLSDLASTNIDLVDRSLYERSCDVRWWANDNSLVNALIEKSTAAKEIASQRLGVILESYTVYFDLVLCDSNGNIIANGKPKQYASEGKNQADTTWFRTAMEAETKEAFGFQTVHRCPLVNNQLAVIFSCPIRDYTLGQSGKVLGILGVIFNWEALSQKIIENTPVSDEEKPITRICIVDDDGTILADSKRKTLEGRIQFPGFESLIAENKGFTIVNYENSECCAAHALSLGYETYSSGWHSIIIQRLTKNA
jgi:hypothetical protein